MSISDLTVWHLVAFCLWVLIACAPWFRLRRPVVLRVALHLKYGAWLVGVFWFAGLFVHEWIAVVISGAIALGVLEDADAAEREVMMPPDTLFIFSRRATPIARASSPSRLSHRVKPDPDVD